MSDSRPSTEEWCNEDNDISLPQVVVTDNPRLLNHDKNSGNPEIAQNIEAAHGR